VNYKQINVDTGKGRNIRPPPGYPPPPKAPLLPTGPMIILVVKAGQAGTMIQVADPNNPGQTIPVYVPKDAKVGAKMAIPIPAKGESVSDVQAKQQKHQAETKGKWSTGGKIAASGAALVAVGAVGVGGVILGDHLAGGDLAETIGETAADWAEDAGDWVVGAGEDIGDALAPIGEDVGDWLGDAGEDAIDWLGDAGEDIGDFIIDLF